DEQRELLVALDLLARQIGGHLEVLPKRNGHACRTSLGSVKWTSSVVSSRSTTSTGPRPRSPATTSSTREVGAEAPAVTATVAAPASQRRSMSPASSTRYAGVPSRSDFSTSRWEFEELLEPITSATSDSRATSCRAS